MRQFQLCSLPTGAGRLSRPSLLSMCSKQYYYQYHSSRLDLYPLWARYIHQKFRIFPSPGEIALAGRCISCPTADCNCGPNEILQQNGCALCPADFVPNSDKTRCIPCQSLFCFCQNGTCSQGQSEAKTEVWLSDGTAVRSVYLEGEVHSTMGRCQQGSSQDCQVMAHLTVGIPYPGSSKHVCPAAF